MIFSNDVSVRVAIFVLGLCGFWVARHVYKHKNNEKDPLVCPIKFDCHTVVHSDYSKLFGVPVEILGMLYYGLVFISYFFFIFMPQVMPLMMVNFLIAFSLIAFLFSLYLMSILIFVLRKGCSWCIVSACISSLIFMLTVVTYHLGSVVKTLI